MRVAIPHDLDKATVRQRLRGNSHTLGDHIPGAQVATSWPSEDRMTMTVSAMGQSFAGDVEIEERQVVFTLALPPALGFIEPIVEGAIRQQGQKLLAPPTGS
ncbi:polyhydroxyalkanoic acid system family protein [Altericroceibacterium xinjiangense]|uniref:polyhydroxyalkanoic acid system family protein n=1 Tax=Altericroceibacterium xinjiangense TaxID=762261 RepID=UPI000F7F4DFF|nr:polyhydroxyalkanoic acid system family protein [Altericroceibacterium xinjiangense]